MLNATSPASHLLTWYDRHARTLPWRARPGEASDPYAVWLSEVMLQQTGVKTVGPYFQGFLQRWPKVDDLAQAELDDVLRQWAGLGYYSRARSLHACAKMVVAEFGGAFPANEAALLTLPGIGPYTAAAIAAIAFGLPAVVVDGNIERVVSRLNAIDKPLAQAKPAIKDATAHITPQLRAGDFAQAMMDLGATICTPTKPACVLCPLAAFCDARRLGRMEQFPVKSAKNARPQKTGAIFHIWRSDGYVLVQKRPPRGLLGGMTQLPGSDWASGYDPAQAPRPLPGQYRQLPGTVRHVFTHFGLDLTVFCAKVRPHILAPGDCFWVEATQVDALALPTLMRKVLARVKENE